MYIIDEVNHALKTQTILMTVEIHVLSICSDTKNAWLIKGLALLTNE
jgi:hypothetical protein